MTYLVADNYPAKPAGQRFREQVDAGAIVRMPGTHNGLAALQAKRAGFSALYLSGAAMTASMSVAIPSAIPHPGSQISQFLSLS